MPSSLDVMPGFTSRKKAMVPALNPVVDIFINNVYIATLTHAAVAKGYSDALVRRRSWVQFPSAAPLLLCQRFAFAFASKDCIFQNRRTGQNIIPPRTSGGNATTFFGALDDVSRNKSRLGAFMTMARSCFFSAISSKTWSKS